MRISDWSSDVCSSDLLGLARCRIEQKDLARHSRLLPDAQKLLSRSLAVEQQVGCLVEARRLGLSRLPSIDGGPAVGPALATHEAYFGSVTHPPNGTRVRATDGPALVDLVGRVFSIKTHRASQGEAAVSRQPSRAVIGGYRGNWRPRVIRSLNSSH